MKEYTQLSQKERRQIYIFLEMGLSKAKIAKRLGRHKSTIYNEINRNKENQGYFPVIAHNKARTRKEQNRPCKMKRNRALYDYVIKRLKKGWSPEQISARMKLKNKPYYICHESIYSYIYRQKNKGLYQCLAYKKYQRGIKFGRKHRKCRYGEKRLITNRAEIINTRTTFGHWEGDSMIFSSSRRQSIATVVERKSRVVVLTKNDNCKSETVMGNIENSLINAPKKACLTITFDQGSEFAHFRKLENNLKCKVYYCEVRSPWQKGSNENMNGRLRRYLPRDINIRQVTQEELNIIAKKLNNTPRKCLGFKTPREVYLQQCKKFDGLML